MPTQIALPARREDIRHPESSNGIIELCCPTNSSIRLATGAAHRIAQIGTFLTAASAKCIPASESTHQANRRRHAFHNPAAAHTGNNAQTNKGLGYENPATTTP